jgi:hypothetical protein
MSAIKPNKNFYNEPPDVINTKPHFSSSTTRLQPPVGLIPNKRLQDVYERFFKEKTNQNS